MTFADAATSAWSSAANHDFDMARYRYNEADRLNTYGGCLNATTSLLRHRIGIAKGLVVPPDFDEEAVPWFAMTNDVPEQESTEGLRSTGYTAEGLEANIRRFIEEFRPGFHQQNINQDLPHVMVLSTGRCGTVSLYRLLEGSDVVPYHAYWFNVSLSARWEMMCRLLSGEFSSGMPLYQDWLATRSAEWCGATSAGLPMVGLNHTDLIFAPIFAAIHPRSRFVWLQRDERTVANSYILKDQSPGEVGNQLRPLLFGLDPFRWKRTEHHKTACIEWLIRFTAAFCRALKNVVGDRMIYVRAEELFDQRPDTIHRLLDFIGSDIPLGIAAEHFKTPFNVKAHKA